MKSSLEFHPLLLTYCSSNSSSCSLIHNRNSYEGRCNTNTSDYAQDLLWLVHPGFQHRCYTLKPSPSRNESNWPEVKDYIEVVENYTRTCDNCTESVIFLKEYGITVTSEMGRYVWASRQAHSVFMVIAVIFTYPVSRFVARFYNETYMDRRVGANLQVWYSVRSTLKTNINGSS